MPDRLTRQGALNLTSMLDRVANVLQHRAEVLGIPADVALDFAKRADMISDAIEKQAAANYPLVDSTPAQKNDPEVKGVTPMSGGKVDDKPASSDQNKPETYNYGGKKAAGEPEPVQDEDDKKNESTSDKAPDEPKTAGCEKLPEGGMRDNCEAKKSEGEGKKDEAKTAAADFPVQPGKDETGTSVDHGTAGFDANAIGDDHGGPRLQEEPWMAGHFSQENFHVLRNKVEQNLLPAVGEADAKLASLRSLVADIQASMTKMEKDAAAASTVEASNDWGFKLTE